MTARIDSAVLDGNTLSMSGVVTIQIVNNYQNVTDETDIVGKSGSSALIMLAKLEEEHLVLK